MRTRPEGIRITRVGFWFVIFAVVVAIAATNTGNNALYMVLAVMLALLVVSGVVSRANVRGFAPRLEVPDEIFANRPFQAHCEIDHQGRWLPRWLLIVSLSYGRAQFLVPYLSPGGRTSGRVDLLFPRRGVKQLRHVHAWSVFPLGFFRKGTRYEVEREILVYPELYPEATVVEERVARHGEQISSQRGWGHELHSLRGFRPGDDPRSIHWKRSASSGGLIFMEREAEEGHRLSIVFDNAVGGLIEPPQEERFERLVSEAATAAHQYLAAGFDVELVTREGSSGFGSGPAHRRRLLEHLARIEALPRASSPLKGTDPGSPELRLAMRRTEVA